MGRMHRVEHGGEHDGHQQIENDGVERRVAREREATDHQRIGRVEIGGNNELPTISRLTSSRLAAQSRRRAEAAHLRGGDRFGLLAKRDHFTVSAAIRQEIFVGFQVLLRVFRSGRDPTGGAVKVPVRQVTRCTLEPTFGASFRSSRPTRQCTLMVFWLMKKPCPSLRLQVRPFSADLQVNGPCDHLAL